MGHLFSTVLNMSMTGSVVILLVMLARLILKRSPKIFSYALWSVVLFRLLCPVAFTAPVSVLNALKPEAQEASEGTSVVYFIPAEVNQNQAFTFVPAEKQSGAEPEQAGETEHTGLDLMTVASYAWIIGTCIMILYSIIQYIRLRLKLVGAMACRGNVYRSDYIDTPFVMGILQPKIYLPSDIPTKERKYIIAHERHHIRRFDHIIKLLAYLALCIHWFNPLVWVAFILAGKDMEMSCDEAVIRKMGSQIRADYSASLLRLATHKKIIAGMPLAFGEGDTKGRVMNMAKWKKPKLWVSLICLLLCTTILAACAVNPETAGSTEGMNTTAITGRVTSASDLNIRKEPSISSAVVGNYSSGETITILETQDGWGRTNEGWIYMDYVAAIDDTTMVDSAELVPVSNKLNIRKEPDALSAVVGQYSNGETITILETKDGWGRTDQGWIYMDYVTMTDGSTGMITTRHADIEASMPTISASDIVTDPAAEVDPDEQAALAKCRAVLEAVQSGSCHLMIEQSCEGDSDIHWSTANYYQDNGNWLEIVDVDPESVEIVDGEQYSIRMAFMAANGVRYSNEGKWGKAYTDIEWREDRLTFNDSVKPWLASFQWDDAVAYMDTLTDENGECVMLRVDEKYKDSDEYDPHYFVNIHFDAEGNFVDVQLQVNLFRENELALTESIVSTDPEAVNSEIQNEYQRAIG